MKNRTNIRWLTQLALLVAILLVLNYTPLGYLQIGPLSASLLTVPVAIGAMTMGPAAGAILGGLLMLFGRGFLSLFANDAEVINAGMERLYIMGWSYPIAAFMDCTIAAARGIGRTVVPTIMVIMGSCVFRVVWVYTIFAHFQTITSLYLLYSFSWAITAVAEIAYFLPASRKCRFAEDKPALGKSA